MPLHRLFFLTLLVVLLSPSLAFAQDGTVTLSGTVVDLEGRRVAGATVRADGGVVRAVQTDPRGTFRIGPLPVGTYVLSVEALGYTGATLQVEPEGRTTGLELVVDAAPLALEPLEVIGAIRGGRPAVSLPIKVAVIEPAEVQLQRTLSSNPTELLANLIPSYSPGRQKLTSSGESFRGRRPLFLIDGVPQSNPLRDGRRDGFTIGMEVVDRVEVVFGANALQGLGATGGIINYVTVSAPRSGALEQRVSLSTTSNDSFEGNGQGWRAHYLVAQRFEKIDVLGSFSYERRGLQFDGENRAIAIDNVQGDIADSRSRNFFGKIGWEPDFYQRLQLSLSDFRLAQNGDFDSVDGDRSAELPATSVEGNPEGVQPVNDVTTVSLDYEHASVLGGILSAKAYLQDFRALFGGGRFRTFQDPTFAPIGELFDQSENNSQKVGTRLTWSGTSLSEGPLDAVVGFDFLRDETFQRLVQTDRNWVPPTRFFNYAPFLQLDMDVLDGFSLSGGMRWELARLDIPNFTTLAGNRDDFRTTEVAGGTPSFDEPLFNIGAVAQPLENLRIYGTLSQAYTMPDVGRVLRGISAEGVAVEDFFDLEPIKTENVEVGGAFSSAGARLGVTYFKSSADLGSRLVPNVDGIFQVRRQPTRISGWEFTGRIAPQAPLVLSVGYSVLDGRFDGDDDGRFEADLGARNIGPNRLNVALDVAAGGVLSGRLQTFRYFDRTFRDEAGDVAATFDGYTTTDASVAARLGSSTVTLALMNLFDQQFITYYGQAATTRNDRYFAGRGRTVTLNIESRF